MEIVLVLSIGFMCMCCFLLGAKLGQIVRKGEDIKLPTINPIEAYRERENKKHARMEQDKLDTIMRNIEAYDGTDSRQEDLPG
jgi:hypothetical protein